MSHLNLWPWRERQKKDAMRRWVWGAACMAMLSIGVVAGIDHALTNWQQQHDLQRQQWADELTSLKAGLADAPLWQARERQAQQIRLDGQRWAQQQQQAWQVLHRLLALPPQGLQLTKIVWQDKQLHIHGWAVSAAHLQHWQDALQAQRMEWHDAQWRQADGVALRQFAFVLKWPANHAGAGS